MTKLLILAVLGFVIIATSGAKVEPEPPFTPPTIAPTKPPVPTTTTTVTPNTTTTSTTTVAPTTSTTAASTTSTTAAPTTPAPKTTTVAPVPSTTTVPPPAPKPVEPEVGFWSVNVTGTNVTCVMVKMAAQFVIPYGTASNKTQDAYVNVPANATVNGTCGPREQIVSLMWSCDGANDTATLTFGMDSDNVTFYLASIKAHIVPDKKHFPGAVDNKSIALFHTKTDFNTSITKSYKCAKEQSLNMSATASTNVTLGTIHISQVQLEAFHKDAGKDFNSAMDCEGDETADVVPIAVGCALAALIIIVLIAYLIGRRRSQARGYLSM